MALLEWIPVINMLAVPIASAAAGYGLKLMRQQGMDTRYYEAVTRAGGAAYSALIAAGGSPKDPAALRAAALAGGQYLIDRVPKLLAERGLTPDNAAQVAHAELGKLLALDPTVAPSPKGPAL